MPLDREQVIAALRTVKDPELHKDIVTLNMVKDVRVDGGAVHLTVELTTPACPLKDVIQKDVETALRRIGVEKVNLNLTANTKGPLQPRTDLLPQVKNVIAVGAGKGGVGKSTVAVNLALALAREGLRVGLLDADIYGPSLPLLLGIEDGTVRARMTPEKHVVPLEAHGIPLVSFGFFLGERSPAIWRGPMVAKAVKQFARGVAWPALDLLIVDLPPGTGDVPLSLAQAIELSGAVIVTQPARVATTEAIKAARMFSALDVRILGVLENMTGPFGAGAGESVSRELEVPFLGALPFDHAMVREGDAGIPTVVARPHGAMAAGFAMVAQRVAEQLGWTREESLAVAGREIDRVIEP